MNFESFPLNENILRGVRDAGFTECMPVQEMTLAHTLNKKDVAVQSQTGSGKTAAFLLSIFQLMSDDEAREVSVNSKALIIAPTRELAIQIEEEAKLLGKYMNFLPGCFYGGVGYAAQEKLIKDGVNIIIGTPGRLIDLNDSRKLSFKDVRYLVIDEADRLFDMGFLPDLKRILKRMPDAQSRQSMIFSATLGPNVRELAAQFMNSPVEIELAPDSITVETIAQSLYHVGKDEKISLLLGLLKKDKPANAIIFTNTKIEAMEVANRLEYNGFHCEYIIGDLPQKKRQQIIESVKSGKIKYLIATDVAARGLHVDDLELVVNYDLPEYSENYVHRIGRTARAGKSGKAITFACEKYIYGLESIESFIKMKIPVEWPEDAYYHEDASKHIRFRKHDIRGDRKRRTVERKGPAKGPMQSKGAGARKSGVSLEAKPAQKRQPKQEPRTPRSEAELEKFFSQKQKGVKKPEKHFSSKKYNNKSSIEDRLEYYKSKYGESFVLKDEAKQVRKPFIKRIMNFFTRNK